MYYYLDDNFNLKICFSLLKMENQFYNKHKHKLQDQAHQNFRISNKDYLEVDLSGLSYKKY